MANATPWNSQLTMIKPLHCTPQSIMDKIQYSGKLTVYETSIAKDMVEVLQLFEWATNMVQGQNKVTSSLVIPVVRALKMNWKTLALSSK